MTLLELAKEIGVEGFLRSEELDKLVELACNKDVLEIGAFKGLSAWGMAITAKSVMSVDTFKANSAGQQQMPEETTLQDYIDATDRYSYVGHVNYFKGTSKDAGIEAAIHDDLYDMIFLDAMHTYEDVKADIERWWPRVREGGLMAFHDYGHEHFPGVKKAVDEKFGPATPGTVETTLRWIYKLQQ